MIKSAEQVFYSGQQSTREEREMNNNNSKREVNKEQHIKVKKYSFHLAASDGML